jgi:hypothetical protein
VAGAQDLQEVPPALGEAGGEEGEAIVPICVVTPFLA